ncbi:MAG: hypothetical protein SFU99_03970 [Saprospiraceae bacterium]|nr:hypothetical protein [Saprospiraceae bacterium]
MSKVEKMSKEKPKFKVVKKVTGVPFLKIETHKPVYVRFTSPITVGQMKKKEAFFSTVDNMETGEVMKLLVNKVLSRQLNENYPNDSFVGKTFEIIKGEKKQGNENAYYEFELTEIEM